MKKLFALSIIFVMSIVAFPCTAWANLQISGGSSIQVYAANALSKVLPDLENAYASNHTGVVFGEGSYRSSDDLLARLEIGENPDVVFFADDSTGSTTMKKAVEEGLVDEPVLNGKVTSELVMVTSRANSGIDRITLNDLASGRFTICLGDDSVPSGNLANQALSTIGCFVDPDGKRGPESSGRANGTDAYAGTPIQGKVTLCTTLGNTLSYVHDGKADIGIVPLSEVVRFGYVLKFVGMVPSDTHAPNSFPAAVVAGSAKKAEAKSFLDFCCSAEAQPILKKWGFNCTSIEDYEAHVNLGSSVIKIDSPKVANFVYDGKAKVALASTGEYVVSGVSTAANVGKYTLSVTPRSGYAWRNGSRDSLNLVWEIKAAKPVFKIKTTSKTVSMSKARKQSTSFKMGVSVNSKAKVTYKVLKKNSKLTFKNGKVTLKSGRYKKGASYSIKVRVKCAAKGGYVAGHKDIVLAFKIK